MLSIARVGRGRQAYYLATVPTGSGHDSGLVEPDGEWLGAANVLLDLSGAVDAARLGALLSGSHPATGERLSPTHQRVRVAGFDCTFSTPKSVSLLHALGPDEAAKEVRASHDAAVEASLAYLERAAAFARARDGAGTRRAEGLAAAAFVHRASRAPDPHLHTHVLVANIVPLADGRWSPLDARALFLQVGTASHLYEAHLRWGLATRLGLRFGPMRGCSADIDGIDTHLLRAFSRRSHEIAERLAEKGFSGPRARRVAALATRAPKDLSLSYGELVDSWRERAAESGLPVGELGRLVGAARERRGRQPERAAREAELLLGPSGLTARASEFSREEVMKAQCRLAPAGAPAGEIERRTDELLASPEIVPRGCATPTMRGTDGRWFPAPVPVLRFSTREVVDIELAIADAYGTERGSGLGVADGRVVESAMAARPELPDAWRELTYRLVESGNGVEVAMLGALPGADRAVATDVLDAARSAWQTSGIYVEGVAGTHRAARRFEAVTGIESVGIDTLGRGPHELRHAVATGRAGVLVIGGAEQLDPRRIHAVLQGARDARTKVVLVAEGRSGSRATSFLSAIGPPSEPLRPIPSREALSRPPTQGPTREVILVGSVQVVFSCTAAGARAAAVEVSEALQREGAKTILVAPDRATARALAECSARSAERPGGVEIVRPHHLQAALDRSNGASVVAVGSAATIPSEIRRIAGVDRSHAVIAEGGDPQARSARAAEAGLPPRLVRSIGMPPRTRAGRDLWRQAALAAGDQGRVRQAGVEISGQAGQPGIAEARLAELRRELAGHRIGRERTRALEREPLGR
jgi:conjugative relaxase-like TrwC/TraI family protein